jgi:hypothetical protein
VMRQLGDRTRIALDVKDRILPLHTDGLSDHQIANVLEIGVSTVQLHLVGRRSVFHKNTRLYVSQSKAICTVCKLEKGIAEFPNKRSNGTSLTEVSFCKLCVSNKRRERLKDPSVYIRRRVNDLKARCNRDGIRFTLTVDTVISMYLDQKGKCFYTDQEMSLGTAETLRSVLSFDRVVPDGGYVIENVVLCTYRANAIKQDMSLEELQAWMPGWYTRVLRLVKPKAGLVFKVDGEA